MVSPLWKACSEGDLTRVLELLNEPSAVDVELKDHTGVTPLIEAVRNGHVEIVKVLLEKGADPSNASSYGRPEVYTSDTVILEFLRIAQNKVALDANASQQPAHDGQDDPEKRHYAHAPDAYTYYPTINPSLSTVNEAGAYYPPAPPQFSADASPNGLGHLPPPDVARMIPCRYFPACRYGAQCMFAHPQPPFFQGPMPPAQYPPYDPMANPYVQQYYPPPQPSFQQPPPPLNGPMTPMSPPPGAPLMHARSPSEVVSPPLGPFSPNGAPPVPYGPMSPPVYSHPGQGHVSMPVPPSHSQQPHPHPGPQSPNLYHPSTSPVPHYPVHQDAYPPPGPPNVSYDPAHLNGVPAPLENGLPDFSNHPNPRDGLNNHRRGSGRRPSFGARRPPCLFFPAGRCKNGDECRFPHVLPENASTPTHTQFPIARGPPRPRGPPHGHVNGANGTINLEAKLNNLTMRDDAPRQKNGVDGSSRSQSSDASGRPKFHQGPKHPHVGPNGHHKKPFPSKPQQRVPSADDFPVLAGSVTPPKVNGNGYTGPTAAQILQAPPPFRNASKETKAEASGSAPETPAQVQAQELPVMNGVSKPPVMSFAAAAATAGTADTPKEVSVSA
ncbi:hypothetical protein NLJ89_g2409 [Agrocybe chaxingu]|uniref:C3H1-type domain-containing protein n=1 Tax=Agrocybe chaxingu TaxID=84603 RepID=A0A9W8MXN8_9AGAR|nr:hypothetical protein NLJ89_g2409 [Agrocybe chaxingu]